MDQPDVVMENDRLVNSPLCSFCGEPGKLITPTTYECDNHDGGAVLWSRPIIAVTRLNSHVPFYGVGIPVDTEDRSHP